MTEIGQRWIDVAPQWRVGEVLNDYGCTGQVYADMANMSMEQFDKLYPRKLNPVDNPVNYCKEVRRIVEEMING